MEAKRGRHASRVGTACVACRASKLRCDGLRPTCDRCRKSQSACVWNDVDRRRRAGHGDDETVGERKGGKRARRGDRSDPASSSLDVLADAAASGRSSPSSSPLMGEDVSPATVAPNSVSMRASASASASAPGQRQGQEQSPRRTMWWEQLLDLSTYGIEADQVSQEMLDTLAGRVAWIDGSHDSAGAGADADARQVEQHQRLQEQQRQQEHEQQQHSQQRREQEQEEERRVVRVQYFRLLGPTGISPGIKKVTVELRLTPTVRKVLFNGASQPQRRVDWERLLESSTPPPRETEVDAGGEEGERRDPSLLLDGDLPAQALLDELVPIFFDRLGDHYPCLDRAGFEARLAAGGAGVAMLVNVVCALAARYSTSPLLVGGAAHTYGRVFADKAKTFLATSLSVPSRTTCLAFAMMAWHEFSCNLDSAFWNYAGMSLRMAIDLGLHRRRPGSGSSSSGNGDGAAAERGMIDDGLLFWTVYQMDRVLAMGTGRPMSIKDDEITCPLPDRTRSTRAFDHHIVHVRIGGKVAEALNAVLEQDRALLLDRLEEELIQSYESMPAHLELTPTNFKLADDKHVFLELHLWFHCLVFLLNRPPIVDRRRHRRAAGGIPDASFDMVRMAVERCKDIVALDEAHDGQFLTCAPMANQTLFLAGCAELDELKRQQAPSSSSATAAAGASGQQQQRAPVGKQHLTRTALRGFRTFAAALERMSVYWDGIRWIHGVLTQRQMGIDDDDLVELAVGTDALVTRREMRLLQRLHASSTSTTALRPRQEGAPASQMPLLPSPLTALPLLPPAPSSSSSSPPLPPQVSISEVESLAELESLFPQLFPPPAA